VYLSTERPQKPTDPNVQKASSFTDTNGELCVNEKAKRVITNSSSLL